jgi:outer membrane protein, multidrug efflux system
MSKFASSLVTLAVAGALTACAGLQPRVPDAAPSIAPDWPMPASTIDDDAGTRTDAAVADIGWRDFFVDQRLETLIDRALQNNRDLRVAILNVERARAQYRIQRADRLPSVGASVSLNRVGGDAPQPDIYSAGIGITEFELDLFGRVRSLSDAALQNFLATEETQRSAQLSLIAGIASTWLALAADLELQRIAQATLQSHEASFKLTEQRHSLGAVSALDVSQARTVVESARADAARFAGQVAQDRNALTLLVGETVDPSLLPDSFQPEISGLRMLPAGLPSESLLRRPDVIAAEHQLLAANANIGAARAAFFPSISLTGSAGSASDELGGLFESGSRSWSFIPRINIPIFQGGRLRAALGVAVADRDIALARYEQAIQAGFRDVADALALSVTLADQRRAQEALLAAALRTHELSEARYKAGQDSYLVLLDAQRTLYSARQSLIVTQQAEQANRVQLYTALGGGWLEASE